MGANIKPVETMYLSAIKQLLGVRTTTPNATCLIECDMPPLSALLAQKQSNFLVSIIEKRVNMENEDPFMFVWSLLKRYNRPLSQKVDNILQQSDHIIKSMRDLKRTVSTSQRTKSVLYCRLNPDLITHPVYNTRMIIPEHYRISFTRLRLTSHNLTRGTPFLIAAHDLQNRNQSFSDYLINQQAFVHLFRFVLLIYNC